MDRFLIAVALCACMCLAPVRAGREARPWAARTEAQRREERALFSVLYPRFAGWDPGEDTTWYSVILSLWRGACA